MLVAIDFEYNQSGEEHMGLISCALKPEGHPIETFWLHDGSDNAKLVARIGQLSDATFVGYYIDWAEGRCFCALGIDPRSVKWRDCFLEWRWLRNHDNRYIYGKVIKNNFLIHTFAPRTRVGKRASQLELEEAAADNAEYLAELQAETDEMVGTEASEMTLLDAMVFFDVLDLDGYRIAEEQKKRVRDEIIVKRPELVAENRSQILDYNSDDIVDLLTLANKLTAEMVEVGGELHWFVDKGVTELREFTPKDIHAIQLRFGHWAVQLSTYSATGLPINQVRLERLLEVTPILTEKTVHDWNRQHPDTPMYRIGQPAHILAGCKQPKDKSPYIKYKVTKDDTMIEGIIEEFCRTSGLENYPRTRTGKPDTNKKTIERFATGENLLKHYERHEGQLSTLKTFKKDSNGKVEALKFIGSDFVQRPHHNPCGTQTCRNGAKAKSYCFLGPGWLRVIVDPRPGTCIVELDYSNQEFWIAAVQSDCDAMRQAYFSNCIYMYYAQKVGLYPKDLPIPTEEQRGEDWFKPYKRIRSMAKSLTLSIQYGAGYKSVSAAIRDGLKDPKFTDEMGRDMVDDFNATYPEYADWVQTLRSGYREGGGIALSNGWRIGKDNPSVISASNVPVQGTGSCILMEACRLMDEAGLTLCGTLHDAVSLLCREEDVEAIATQASDIMKQAAFNVLGTWGMKVGIPEIIRHGGLWIHSEKAEKGWERVRDSFNGTY